MRKDKKVWHKVLSMLLVAALLITSAPQAYANSPTTYLEESPENKTETAEPNSGSDSTEGKDSTEETRTEEAENASSEEKSSKEGEEPSEEDQSEEEGEQVEGETPLEEGQPEGKDNPASGGEEGQIGSETPLEEGQTEGENAPIEEKKPGLIENAINAISTLLGFSPFSTGTELTDEQAKFTNIIVKYTDKEDPEDEDWQDITKEPLKDRRFEADDVFRIEYEFEVKDTANFSSGDYIEIDLPEYFPISTGEHQGELKGEEDEILAKYEFLPAAEGGSPKLRVTFMAEDINALFGVKGTAWLETKFSLEELDLGDGNHSELKFPISEDNTITVPIYIKPAGNFSPIYKEGKITAPGIIQWTIDVNKGLEKITDATIIDTIGPNHAYKADSFEIYELKIDITGTNAPEVKPGGPISEGSLTVGTPIDGWTFDLGTIEEAYRIIYETTYDPLQDGIGNSPLENTVWLNNETPVKGEVTPANPKYIEKDGEANSTYNPQYITWTLTVNENKLPFNKLTVKDTLPAGLKYREDSLTVTGSESGSKAVSPTITPSEDDTVLEIPIDTTSEAWTITYITDITDYTKTSFTNSAKVYVDDSPDHKGDPAEKTVTFNRGNNGMIHKTGEQVNPEDGKYSEDKYFKWTIIVNSVGAPLKNAVVTDILEGNHALVGGSIKISERTNTSSPATYSEDASKTATAKTANSDGATNLTFTLGDIDKEYKIEYRTKVDKAHVGTGDGEDEPATFKNTATLTHGAEGLGTGPGYGYEGDLEKEVEQTLEQNSFDKSFTSIDYSAKTMTWTITIDPAKTPIKELVVTDTLGAGLKLKEAPKVYKGSSLLTEGTGNDYTYTPTKNSEDLIIGFKIEFNSELKDSVYTIVYVTDFDRDLKGTTADEREVKRYENTVNFSWKELNDTVPRTTNKDAHYDITDRAANNGEKKGELDAANREIKWSIWVNHLSEYTAPPFTVEDTIIGAGTVQNFKDGSIKISSYSLNAAGAVQNLNDVTDSIAVEYLPSDSAETITGFKITLPENKPYLITYNTKFTDESAAKYENKAVVENRDEFEAEVDFSTHTDSFASKAVSKNGRELTWTVTVNDSRSLVENAKVTDSLDGEHAYDDESFKVTNLDTGTELTLDTDYILTFTKNASGYPVSFTLEWNNSVNGTDSVINQKYEIKYTTVVYAKSGPVVAKNDVKFTGQGTKIEQGNNNDRETATVNTSTSGGSIGGSLRLVTIKKIDANNPNTALPGAEFDLVLNNEVVGKVTTGKDGTAVILIKKNTQYKLVETKAPEGYKLPEETERITEIPSEDADEITITNEKVKSAIVLYKISDNGLKTPLKGAEFGIYKASAPTVLLTTAASDSDGLIAFYNMEYGDYIIKEISAPSGYEKSDDEWKAEVTKEGETVYAGINGNGSESYSVVNKSLKGTLIIKKVDKDSHQTPLKGAEFKLYPILPAVAGIEGERVSKTPLDINIVTGEDGTATIENLPYGKYFLKETKSPSGYYLNEAGKIIEFFIADDGATIDLTTEPIENTKIPLGTLIIKKVAYENNSRVLKGAEFEIRNENNQVVAKITTGDDGIAKAPGLEYGTYYIKETKAPSGYILNSTVSKVVLGEDNDNVLEKAITITNRTESGTPTDPDRPDRPDPDPDPDPKQPEKPKEPEKPVTPPEPGPEKPVIPLGPRPEPGPEPEEEGEIEIPNEEIPLVSVPPKNGKVTVDENGKWTYTRDPGFTGEDSFVIRVTHPDGTYEDILVEIPPLGSAEFTTDKKKNPKTGIESNNMVYLVSGSMLLAGAFIFLTKKPNKSA